MLEGDPDTYTSDMCITLSQDYSTFDCKLLLSKIGGDLIDSVVSEADENGGCPANNVSQVGC